MVQAKQMSTRVRIRNADGVREIVQVTDPLPETSAPGDMVLIPLNGNNQLFILSNKQWTWQPGGWVVEFSLEFAEIGKDGGYSQSRRDVLTRNGWI